MKQTLSLTMMMFLVVGIWYSVGYMQGFEAGESYRNRATLGDGNAPGDSDE